MPWLICHSIFLGRGEMLPDLSFLQTAILSVVAIPIHFGGVTIEAKKILYAILVREGEFMRLPPASRKECR
jgi:hypothetical protein